MDLSGRLLVISPHLDDAVLSCALLLSLNPQAAVCTIFTSPPEDDVRTDWDRKSGFADAFGAMRTRRSEDTSALRKLGATPIHLPFCDAQYLASPSHESLVASLTETIMTVKPATLLIPMGLFHSDHTMVADACLASIRSFGDALILAYEDVPYRTIPGVLQDRMCVLLERGFIADAADMVTPEQDARHRHLKRAALARYESQLRAFGPEGRVGLDSPERYWRIHATNENGNRHV